MSLFYRMSWIALILSVAMTVLSAWIRLADSGIGCAPWPDCFAQQFVVDPQPGITIAESDSHRGLRVTHRLMASTFAVVILVMTIVSLWYRGRIGVSPLLPVVCFVLTLVLSVVGINTPDVIHPVVTGINLAGGMLLAALVWYLVLIQRRHGQATANRVARSLTLACLALLMVTIASGSWVSGNFAAGQCDGLLSCPGAGDADMADAFNLSRQLVLVGNRMVLGEEQALIGYVHHFLAVLATCLIVIVSAIIVRWRDRLLPVAVGSGTLALVLALLGVLESGGPTLFTASLHNLLALMLLLTLVYQYDQLTIRKTDD